MNAQLTGMAGTLAILAAMSHASRPAEGSYVTGSVAPTNGLAVDLTAAGSLDWVHYGLGGGGDSGDGEPVRKAGGAIIGALSADVPIKAYNYSPNSYTWSDGDSPVAGTNTNGVFINDSLGSTGVPGTLTLSLAASSRPIEARFYVGVGAGGTGTFSATLDDGSGASFSTSFIAVPAANAYDIITIDYASSSASTLTVDLSALSAGFNGVAIDAVTVGFGPSTVPEPPSIALALVGLVGAAGYGVRRRLRAASA